MALTSLSGAVLSLLLLVAGLQLSACLLREIKGLRSGGLGSVVTRDDQPRPVEEVLRDLLLKRRRRTAGDPDLEGDHTFGDGYPTALIHYSGGDSTVIFVLTYRQQGGVTRQSNLYRSDNYGATFENINSLLGDNAVLNPQYYTSDFNQNFLMFAHATEARLYYSTDEGQTFHVIDIESPAINPRTLQYHPSQDGWMVAVDSSSALHASQDYGQSWTKVDDNVNFYQWADQKWDDNTLTVYYTTPDPDNPGLSGNLFFSTPPYNTHQQFDPDFGSHDAFLVHGPYIFAQRTDDGVINLYVSHLRKPFQQAKIPTPYNHQSYLIGNIDELLAMVIIQHEGGFYNLYLSDSTGVAYSLSLRDIVVERGFILDLEVIDGVNGTLIANQYVRDDPSQRNAPVRTLISLDNGGFWELIIPPDLDVNHQPLNCEPPLCSLHLHMDSSAYARLGVYSTSSAPGLIIAHGNANLTLLVNPDLFISRDGGITWEETLKGSWGVNVADHGGLLVAARDYHQEQSNELMYSCDEGFSWNAFEFSPTPATIYGVITEPGQHTTTMSLYGVAFQSNEWRVFTVDFEGIFERDCVDSDYIHWMPWDLRSDTDCILGSTVTIERRKALTCCLNGRDYDRLIHIEVCLCNGEDFECDYGFARDSLTGPCLRDPDVTLADPCADGRANYTASSGYRKIAGDICLGGEEIYSHFIAPCCENSTLPPTPRPPTTDPSTEPTDPTEPTSTPSPSPPPSPSPSPSPPPSPPPSSPPSPPPSHTPSHPPPSSPPSSPSTSPSPSTKPPTSDPNTNRQSKSDSSDDPGPLIGTGVVIAILASVCLVIVIILLVVSMKYSSLRKRHMRLIMAGEGTTRFAFHSDREGSLEPLNTADESPPLDTEEDDEPLAL